MTNESPQSDYLSILSSAEVAVNEGNLELARKKLAEYKQLRKKNEQEFQEEVDSYAESGRGTMHFIFDRRCLSVSSLEYLMEREEEINGKIAKAQKIKC